MEKSIQKHYCDWCRSNSIEGSVVINTWKGTKKEDVELHYCSSECHNEIMDYSSFVNENAGRFLWFITVIVILNIVLPLVLTFIIIPAVPFASAFLLSLLGLIIFIYPIATPETNQMMGIRKSVRLVKRIELSLIVIPLILIILYFIFR